MLRNKIDNLLSIRSNKIVNHTSFPTIENDRLSLNPKCVDFDQRYTMEKQWRWQLKLWESVWGTVMLKHDGKIKFTFRQNTEKLDLIKLLSCPLTRYIE